MASTSGQLKGYVVWKGVFDVIPHARSSNEALHANLHEAAAAVVCSCSGREMPLTVRSATASRQKTVTLSYRPQSLDGTPLPH